jgi:hypothetical protein
MINTPIFHRLISWKKALKCFPNFTLSFSLLCSRRAFFQPQSIEDRFPPRRRQFNPVNPRCLLFIVSFNHPEQSTSGLIDGDVFDEEKRKKNMTFLSTLQKYAGTPTPKEQPTESR